MVVVNNLYDITGDEQYLLKGNDIGTMQSDSPRVSPDKLSSGCVVVPESGWGNWESN